MSNKIEHKNVVLDCQGLACPQPVILTKKAIDQRPGLLTVIVDNVAAKENVTKLATASGYGVSVEETNGLYQMRMIAASKVAQNDSVVSGSTKATATDAQVFLIGRNTLGQGSDELGVILMKSFFVSLMEMSPLPRTIMLINSGVFLAVEDSPVLPALKELSQRGVSIMVCGTCLDYFHLKEKLSVGSISNMYSILSELAGAGSAITL